MIRLLLHVNSDDSPKDTIEHVTFDSYTMFRVLCIAARIKIQTFVSDVSLRSIITYTCRSVGKAVRVAAQFRSIVTHCALLIRLRQFISWLDVSALYLVRHVIGTRFVRH